MPAKASQKATAAAPQKPAKETARSKSKDKEPKNKLNKSLEEVKEDPKKKSAAGSTSKSADKTGDHQMPKKVGTPYNLYHNSETMRLKEGGMDHKEAFSVAAKKWASLTDADKKKWEEQSLKLNEERDKKIETIKKKGYFIMPDGSKSIDHKEYQKDHTGEHPLPKRPMSAYFFFNTERAKIHRAANVPHGEVFGKVSQDWQAMTEKQKTPYEKKAAEDKIRFDAQVEELRTKGFYTLADKSKSTDHDELCKPKVKKEKKGAKEEEETAKAKSAKNKKKDMEEVGQKMEAATAKGKEKKARSVSKEPLEKKTAKPKK